jgi:hypothetical protein
MSNTLPDYLLVSPALKEDVVEKQGQIGLLIVGYEEEDSYFLRFEDGTTGTYSAADLLSAKPTKELLQYLEEHASQMSKQDFRTLYNMTLFLDYGTTDAQKKALALAMTNEVTLKASLNPLNETLNQWRGPCGGRYVW